MLILASSSIKWADECPRREEGGPTLLNDRQDNRHNTSPLRSWSSINKAGSKILAKVIWQYYLDENRAMEKQSQRDGLVHLAFFFFVIILLTQKKEHWKWSIGRNLHGPDWIMDQLVVWKLREGVFRGSSSNTRINDRGIMGKGPIMERYG